MAALYYVAYFFLKIELNEVGIYAIHFNLAHVLSLVRLDADLLNNTFMVGLDEADIRLTQHLFS